MALTQISTNGIKDATIATADIADINVTTAKIAADAITGAKIADDAIDSEHIADGSIDTAHIAADQITGAKIADDAVGSEHIEQLDADLSFADSAKAKFGAGNDLEIYHDGSNNVISGTVNNWIKSTGTQGFTAGSDYQLTCVADGAVNLYYDGTKQFETIDGGVRVPDSKDIQAGDSGDLKLYHDGSNSYIRNLTGALYLRTGTGLNIQNSGGTETYLYTEENGAVFLRYDNVNRLETRSDGVGITGILNMTSHIYLGDGDQLICGASNDLQIYHTSTNSLIKHNGTGDLYIDAYSKDIYIRSGDGSTSVENAISCIDNAQVELYHSGSKKFETNSTGVSTTGNCIITGHFYGPDNSELRLGSGDDLKIYYDGSNSYIKGNGASCGSITIDNSADADQNIELKAGQDVYLKTHDGSHTSLRCERGGKVYLYWNNNQKLETENQGINVDGHDTAVHVRLAADGSVRGYLYADTNPQIGFLGNTGSWTYRVSNNGDYQHYGSASSDRDRKDNITTVSGTSLDKITKLVPKTYKWKQDDTGKIPTDRTFTGFIAQEVKEHLPSLVTGTDGQKDMAVDYNGILAHAVKAITELSAEVETLKTKVAALEAA